MTITITVEKEDHGKRLDVFLTSILDDVTRSQVQQWLSNGGITCNGIIVQKASSKVQEQQVFVIDVPPPVEALPLPVKMDLDILYEDHDLLVINKPAGLVVHPGAGHYQDTLVNGLLHHCTDLSGIGGVLRPGIVHRLDKDTSGIMVIAKNDKAHHKLSLQFQEKGEEDGILRQYVGFCWNVPYPKTGIITTLVGRDPRDRQRMANVSSNGKESITEFVLQEAYGTQFSKIEFTLYTGRTHQIRLHGLHIGHPLVGDQLYGARLTPTRIKNSPEAVIEFKRQALHACVLEFDHPTHGERMEFETPLPDDMQHLQDELMKI